MVASFRLLDHIFYAFHPLAFAYPFHLILLILWSVLRSVLLPLLWHVLTKMSSVSSFKYSFFMYWPANPCWFDYLNPYTYTHLSQSPCFYHPNHTSQSFDHFFCSSAPVSNMCLCHTENTQYHSKTHQ